MRKEFLALRTVRQLADGPPFRGFKYIRNKDLIRYVADGGIFRQLADGREFFSVWISPRWQGHGQPFNTPHFKTKQE